MNTPYTIVKAECALNSIIDQSRAGGDLWAIEQQKKAFLVALQESISKEVQIQIEEFKKKESVVPQEERNLSSFHHQNGGRSVSYERIERYNTSQGDGGPGWTRFFNNIKSIPYALTIGAIGAFAIIGLLHVAVPTLR